MGHTFPRREELKHSKDILYRDYLLIIKLEGEEEFVLYWVTAKCQVFYLLKKKKSH